MSFKCGRTCGLITESGIDPTASCLRLARDRTEALCVRRVRVFSEKISRETARTRGVSECNKGVDANEHGFGPKEARGVRSIVGVEFHKCGTSLAPAEQRAGLIEASDLFAE